MSEPAPTDPERPAYTRPDGLDPIDGEQTTPELVPGPGGGVAILEAWGKVMAEIQAIAKTDRNEQQNFMFRGIDAVLDRVGPAFREHGIVPMPRLLEVRSRDFTSTNGALRHEVIPVVRYTFLSIEDGSALVCEVPGESADSGDKATPKAMSVAYRTALLQALCIPTGDPDPDSETHERGHAASSASGRRGGSRGGRQQRQERQTPPDDGKVTSGQAETIRTFIERLEDEGRKKALLEAFKVHFDVAKATDVPKRRYTEAMKWLRDNADNPPAPTGGAPAEEPCEFCKSAPCECAPDDDGSAEDTPQDAPQGEGEEPFEPDRTTDDYATMREGVASMERREIQKELAQVGLPATGPDADLIDRLTDHYMRTAKS